MFLVDDDQRESGQFGEHRQACAEHDLRCAQLRLLPVMQTFALAQAAVQADQIHVGEAAAEIIFQLRRQIDLRHQQQHLPAALQYAMHQMHIHFGLAAAGDAVQQEAGIAAGLCDRIHRELLLAGQRVGVVEDMFVLPAPRHLSLFAGEG